jgi:hypothetical protein
LKKIIPKIWIEGWNWKPIKVFPKGPRKKIELKKWGLKFKYQNQRKSSCNFQGMKEKRRRRKKRSTNDKSPLHHWHVSHQQEENMVTFLTTQWKGIFGHHEASHMLSKMRRHLPCTNECPTPANYILFIFISFFIKRLNWSSADMVITKKNIMKKHKKTTKAIFNFF